MKKNIKKFHDMNYEEHIKKFMNHSENIEKSNYEEHVKKFMKHN